MDHEKFNGALTRLRQILSEGSVRDALIYLNSLTPHRFTGMYLFDDPNLKNRYIVDKLNPELEQVPDVPMTATYCAFTRNMPPFLSVTDSREDERVKDHPARDEVISYCGVPLQDDRGEVFGTICHFDYKAVAIEDTNVKLLEAFAPLLVAEGVAG
jgi:hypothetical protein